MTQRQSSPRCEHITDDWAWEIAMRDGLECARCLMAQRAKQEGDRR